MGGKGVPMGFGGLSYPSSFRYNTFIKQKGELFVTYIFMLHLCGVLLLSQNNNNNNNLPEIFLLPTHDAVC